MEARASRMRPSSIFLFCICLSFLKLNFVQSIPTGGIHSDQLIESHQSKMLTAFNLALLFFTIVSSLLYILVLLILIINRHSSPFDGHFFHLFASLGVADISHTIHLFGFSMFRYWGWINFGPLLLHPSLGWFVQMWIVFINEYITINQYLGVFLVAVNRCCNLVHSETNYWSEGVHKFALFIQWLFPFLAAAPWLWQPLITVTVFVGKNNPNVDNYTFISVLPGDEKMNKVHRIIVTLIFSNLITVISAFLYLRMIHFVRKLKKGNNQISTAQKIQIRLAVVGFVLFLQMAAMNLAFLGIFSTRSKPLFREMFTLIHYVWKVLFSISNPWLLLFSSEKTRHKFRSYYLCHTTVVQPLA